MKGSLQNIFTLMLVFTVLLSGIALAGTDFWVRGSYGQLTDNVKDETVVQGESVTYSSYAKSTLGAFTLDIYVSESECVQRDVDLAVEEVDSQFSGSIYEAGVNQGTFETTSLAPGSYNLCMYIERSSGSETDVETLTLLIEEDTSANTAPEFTGLPVDVSLSENDPANTVVIETLSNYVTDDTDDTHTFEIIGNSDSTIADCEISSENMVCTPNSRGTTDVELRVTDNHGATDAATVTVSVNGADENNDPYFQNLDTSYQYDVGQGAGEIFSVDLADYAVDDDGDDLSFSMTESSSLVECTLSDSVLSCEYVAGTETGAVSVDVFVTDTYGATGSETITITIYDGNNGFGEAEAVIEAPSSALAGSEVTFDGSDSTGGDGSEIAEYEWTIGNQEYTGETVTRVFNSVGTYDVVLTVTDENGKEDTATETIHIYSPSTVDLEVNYIRINGEKHDPYDGTHQVLQVRRGQEIPIKLKVTAHTDVKDVQISAKIAGYEYSIYEQEKIFQMSNTFDLDANRWDTRELTLEVPMKVATGDVKLRIYVEDRNSNGYVKEYNLDIEGVENSNAVQIREAYLSPSNEVLPGRALSALVKVENFGEKPLDDVTLVAEVPGLGIRDTETLDELDVDEKETFEKTLLRFPKDAQPGDYEVVYTVTFDEYERTTLRDTVTVLDGESASGEGSTLVNVPNSRELTIGGNGAVYPISITNNDGSSNSYKLSVNGVDSWGSYRVDPSSMLVIPAGETKTAYLYVFADSQQEAGVKEFYLDITVDGETKRVPLSAALNQGEGGMGDTIGDTFFIVLTVLIIVIIIAAIIFGMSRARNGPRDDEDEYY
ncbi:MAG: PKD domain-containing protein [Nanobdellota archaeon]